MDCLETLVAHWRKKKQRQRWLGGAIVALAVGLTFIPAQGGERRGLLLLVVAGVAGGLFLIARAFTSPERDPAVCVLRENPGDIVWAYHHRQLYNGTQHIASVLKLGLRDGRLLTLGILPGQEQAFEAYVAARCPSATIGFDEALEAKFRASSGA